MLRGLGLSILVLLAGCAPHAASPPPPAQDPVTVVTRYFAAETRPAKMRHLSDGFRMWFEERSGEGMTKAQLGEDTGWDDALHARTRIVTLHATGDTVVVQAHEDNDFSLLLGYPGWDPTITYVVGDEGLIESALYVPRAGAPSWHSSLEVALPWLRANRAEALERILPEGKLARTPEAAREWVEILRAWREATGRPDPMRP